MPVVRVVVSGRESVGTEHDAALDLGPEASSASGSHHVLHIDAIGGIDPQAEAHAIEPGQVRRGLGRCDEIVSGQTKHGGGHAHVVNRGPGISQSLSSDFDAGEDIGADSLARKLGDDTDAQAGHAFCGTKPGRGDERRSGRVE